MLGRAGEEGSESHVSRRDQCPSVIVKQELSPKDPRGGVLSQKSIFLSLEISWSLTCDLDLLGTCHSFLLFSFFPFWNRNIYPILVLASPLS
jgi:hypothetical protein